MVMVSRTCGYRGSYILSKDPENGFGLEISSNRQKQVFLKWSISGISKQNFTTKVAHNGHGHFLVKKSVESRSLVEWRTDVFTAPSTSLG